MHIALSLLSAAAVVAAAHPQHAHGLRHAHERRQAQGWDHTTVIVPGPTVTAYVLNGVAISEADVQEGIKNGSLVFGSNGLSMNADTSVAAATSAPVSISSAISSIQSWSQQSSSADPSPSTTSTSSYVAPTTSSSSAATSSAAASWSSSASHQGGPPTSSSGTGVDSAFPDGQLDCSTFPDQYGAVAIDYLGLGGWTGVQIPGSDNGGFSNIFTATSGGCTEGAYCSYACPAGYQKSQWPQTQGATGQSVGGVHCKGGKLHLTNKSLSKSLCMTGASEVTVLVQNQLSQNVAICRTDYPGTESETIPLDTQPGTTSNLTCPDANNYYNWEGGHTSAQYYVNPAGVSAENACQWGSSSNPWGNWAPLNLGVGYSNGAAWLAIFQNAPTTSAKLGFTVTIEGDGISGSCKYSNGQYCSGSDYSSCSSTTGCTVSISSGTATFVLSN